MLETSRLKLRMIDETDTEDIVSWRNHKEIIDSLFSYKGITIEQHKIWYKSYIQSNSRIEWMIIKKEDNSKIGTIGLSQIDHKNQKAEYGIMIGENKARGKGYAKEASEAIIEYGFKELNLNKIYLRVFTDNENAINLYNRLGFREEGILKQDFFKNGTFKDVIIMSVFR